MPEKARWWHARDLRFSVLETGTVLKPHSCVRVIGIAVVDQLLPRRPVLDEVAVRGHIVVVPNASMHTPTESMQKAANIRKE